MSAALASLPYRCFGYGLFIGAFVFAQETCAPEKYAARQAVRACLCLTGLRPRGRCLSSHESVVGSVAAATYRKQLIYTSGDISSAWRDLLRAIEQVSSCARPRTRLIYMRAQQTGNTRYKKFCPAASGMEKLPISRELSLGQRSL